MNEQQVFEAVFKATGVGDFEKAIAGAQNSIKSFESASGKLKDAGKTLTKRVTAPLVALGGVAMAVGSQYETSMSSVQAISGATADEMEALEAVAREMGATTRYSASESADALGYMALAGWDVEQMTSALPSVLNLATAGQLDLATASDIVTDMMSMFGIEAENASQASDVFAAAQAKSNTNVEQLSEALRMAGPAASSAGNSLEDTSAVLGILANNGIKGSSAGTALNAMFMDLQKSAENGAVAIGDTSVAVYDAEGNMRSMVDIVQDVERATQGMSDEQRNAALSQIFQQRSLRGVNVLLNEGSDSLVDLQNELINSNGAAQDMADIMDDNMQGSLLAMKSAAEEVAIQFFEMAEGPIRAIIDGITELIRWFGELSPTMQQVIGIVGVLAAAIGPLLMLIGQIGLGISALGTFFVGTAGSASMFATIMAALTSPVALVIAGIAALVAVGVLLWKNWDTIKEKAQELGDKISEVWNNIKTWTSDLDKNTATAFSNMGRSIESSLTDSDNIVLEKVGSIVGNITDNFDHAYGETGNIFEAIKMTISMAFQDMVEVVKTKASEIWNSITEWFGQLPTWFSETWNSIVESVTEWATNMREKAVEVGTQFVENISTFFSELPYKVGFFLGEVLGTVIQWGIDMWNKAKETGSNFIETITTFFSELPGRVSGFLTTTWANVTTWASNMWTKAKETGANFINGIVEWFSQLPGRISTWITNAYNNVVTWASNMWSKAKEAGSRFITNVINYIQQLPGRIQTWLTNTISRLTTWASNMGSKGREAGTDLLNKTVNAVKGLPGKMATAGADVVKGFWKGITNLGGWIKGKVSSFFGGIVDGVKSKLKIFSPSRVFRDEIGKMIVKGFGQGIDRNEKEAINPMNRMLDNVIGVFDSQTSGLGATFSVTGEGNIASAMNRALDVDMPMMNGRVSHELNNNMSTQPAYINVSIGGQNFRGFVENISNEQGRITDLELQF